MRPLILLVLAFTAGVVVVPTVAVADSATHTYLLVMEGPNFGVAANGDQIAVTGEGEFSVNPNAVDATGAFTHTDSSGNVLATGTWTATGSSTTSRTGAARCSVPRLTRTFAAGL
jgi:hypothetical protein